MTTREYIKYTTKWGATFRKFRHISSTPECLSYTITTPDKWREAKKRITPSAGRIDWRTLDTMYKEAKLTGDGLEAGIWFGFDTTHSYIVGTETFFMAINEGGRRLHFCTGPHVAATCES